MKNYTDLLTIPLAFLFLAAMIPIYTITMGSIGSDQTLKRILFLLVFAIALIQVILIVAIIIFDAFKIFKSGYSIYKCIMTVKNENDYNLFYEKLILLKDCIIFNYEVSQDATKEPVLKYNEHIIKSSGNGIYKIQT